MSCATLSSPMPARKAQPSTPPPHALCCWQPYCGSAPCSAKRRSQPIAAALKMLHVRVPRVLDQSSTPRSKPRTPLCRRAPSCRGGQAVINGGVRVFLTLRQGPRPRTPCHRPRPTVDVNLIKTGERDEYDRCGRIVSDCNNLAFYFSALENMSMIWFRPGFLSSGYKW
jgi:hypothetical protein